MSHSEMTQTNCPTVRPITRQDVAAGAELTVSSGASLFKYGQAAREHCRLEEMSGDMETNAITPEGYRDNTVKVTFISSHPCREGY